jgi:FAD-linked oxidoreductase
MTVSRRKVVVGAAATAAAVAAGVVLRKRSLDADPAMPALQDSRQRLLWRNWSGIQMAYPALRAGPTSEDEVLAALSTGPAPVRAVGAGHSFTALVPTDGTLLSLDGLSGVLSHDVATNQATVWAGTRLGELGPALAALGQCMPNLPDINKQSLGGAIATATHGSGDHSPALHGQVLEMRIATPARGFLDCSRTKNPEVFDAARVGLGAFGVVTQYRLQNIPSVRLLKRTELRPTNEVIEDWPRLRSAHRNAEFFVLPFTGMSATVTHDITDLPATPPGRSQDSDVLLDLKWLRDWTGFIEPLRRRLAQAAMAGLKPEQSVEEAWKLLSNERDIRFNEMEYHLPRETQMAALREVLGAIEKHRPDVFFPIEVRSISQDDAWLSPFHDRPSGSLAVHAYYKDDYQFLFDLVEPILQRHGGRPHWGKLHTLTGRKLAPAYPRWDDAMKVRRELDPQGRMLNPFLRRLFGDE